MTAPIDFLAELRWRGMLHQATEGLEGRLASGRTRAYVGFDPTADSLHVGHLIPIFGLIHFQRAGHVPVALVGGGTGMIGDPSGKSAERNLLDTATLDANAAAIRGQLERFLDFTSGPTAAVMLDNREWLSRYGLIDFLRDIGKHFSLGYMLGKDSVQLRLETGISFTEFSYMTLQSTDFLHLHRDYGVDLQMGGADQWGNITAGTELIRKVLGLRDDGTPRAHALVHPLLTMPSGKKFGKTEEGSVFLSPARTSPYAFFQYWVNSDDRDVGELLRFLTLLDRETLEALDLEQTANPGRRAPQRALARDLTARVHGRAEADLQERVSEAAFSPEPIADPVVLDVLYEHVGGFEIRGEAGTSFDLLLASGAFPSRGELRRTIGQGGVSIDGVRVTDGDAAPPELVAGRYHVVRVGRRRLVVGRVAQV
jgi:tyrosyl-tRNA synthetase